MWLNTISSILYLICTLPGFVFTFPQTFLSELYVYLIDQMHVSLGSVLALEDQPPIPKPLTDSAQLKHFAREAEVNENFALAEKYYQEVRKDHNCFSFNFFS